MSSQIKTITLENYQCIGILTKPVHTIKNWLNTSIFNYKEDCLRMTGINHYNNTFFNKDNTFRI